LNCSIIIRTYNEERHIGRLIDGINSQLLPNHIHLEIIVIDSGSTDATLLIAKNMGAKILNIPKNDFSFGRALNLGCQHATGKLLIFASAHVYPLYTHWLSNLITPFENEDVALVYGKQTGNHLTHFSEQQVFEKWFPKESNYDQKTPFCNNANCAIRKELWMKTNYNDYLTGLEDLDWAKRIQHQGFKIVYEAKAVIVHIHEETPIKIRNRYQREAIALHQIMPNVHVSFFNFIVLFLKSTIHDTIEAIKYEKLFSQFLNIISFRYLQFYGTYLGHKQNGQISQELKDRFYYPSVIKNKNNSPKFDLETPEDLIKYEKSE
jgi:glycosyltransferase involved in cell wall biosynthesis